MGLLESGARWTTQLRQHGFLLVFALLNPNR